MHRSLRRCLAALAFLAIAAGCGGGGSTMPSATPTQVPTADVGFTIVVPVGSGAARRRRPAALPASAESVTVTLVVAGATSASPSVTIDLFSSSNDCKASGANLSCTGSLTVPVGQQQFVVSTFNGPAGTGALLSTGSITVQVQPGGVSETLSNQVSLTLNPIVASITLSVTPSQIPLGTAQAVTIAVTASDPSGAIIIGPGSFANGPIDIDVPVPNPYFPSQLGTTIASITAPSTPITLQYQGAGLFTQPSGGSLAFTASAANVPEVTASLAFVPPPSAPATPTPTPGATLTPVPSLPPCVTPSPTPTPVPQFSVTPNTITFAGTGPQPTQTFTAFESGVTSFTAVSQNAAIATVSGSGTTFTVAAGSTSGQTGIVVTDPNGGQATVTVTTSGQTICIQTKPRKIQP